MFGELFNMNKTITGEIYPITLDKKNIFKGWYAIRDSRGNYYLIERSFSLSSNFKRNLYVVNESIVDMIITEKQQLKINKKKRQQGIIGITIIVAAIVRLIIPKEYIFGNSNNTGNHWVGLFNIFVFLMTVLAGIFILYFYRKKRVERLLPSLKKIGRVRLITPLIKLKNGKEFW